MSKLGSKRRKEPWGGQSRRSRWTINDVVAEKGEGLLYLRRRTRARICIKRICLKRLRGRSLVQNANEFCARTRNAANFFLLFNSPAGHPRCHEATPFASLHPPISQLPWLMPRHDRLFDRSHQRSYFSYSRERD